MLPTMCERSPVSAPTPAESEGSSRAVLRMDTLEQGTEHPLFDHDLAQQLEGTRLREQCLSCATSLLVFGRRQIAADRPGQ